MDKKIEHLIEKAIATRLNAHAPYSNFLVGSAVLDENNNISSGCNVENAAYPSGSCAEEQAIRSMIAKGGKQIKEIVVVGRSDELVTPCGACRQRIREFGNEETKIHVCDSTQGLQKTFTLKELLPHSFGPDNL